MMNLMQADRVAEIEQFLAFLASRWPKLRRQVSGELAARCSRCILSQRYAPLEDGLCPRCRGASGTADVSPPIATAASTQQAATLDVLLKSSACCGRGMHDALLMFSGGKDSAILLYRLRTQYPGLRLLAVTVDNGFFSGVAMANARRICERMGSGKDELEGVGGVDHMVFRPRTELFVKTFRHAFTHLNEGGCYTTVDRMDGDLVFDIGRNLAAMLDIPLMIAGLSSEQVRRVLGLEHFESPRQRELSRRTESAGFKLDELYTDEELRYWWDGSRWGEDRVPRLVFPFFAWDYDEAFVRREVVRLGLVEPGRDNPLVTNNDTIPVMLAVDNARMGYSGFEPEFAELVRAGKADRMGWLCFFEAIEYLVQHGRFLPHCIAETLERLDLTEQDVGIPKLQLNGEAA